MAVFPQSHSSCRRELSVLGRRTDKVPFVAGDVEKHGDAAVGFGARCREELHARGHPTRPQRNVRMSARMGWTRIGVRDGPAGIQPPGAGRSQ